MRRVLIFFTLLSALAHAEIFLTFPDESVASGHTVIFRCNVNQAVGFNITGVFITNTRNQSLPNFPFSSTTYAATIGSAQYADTGVYTCTVTVTDSLGVQSTLTNTAQLTVYVPADIVTPPQGGKFISRSPFSLTCRAQGFPTVNLSWLREGQPISDISLVSSVVSMPFIDSTLSFPDPVRNESGNYSCQVTNMYTLDDTDFNNLDTSPPAFVKIRSVPMVTSLEDRNVTLSESVSIVCNASGELPLSFSWQNVTDVATELGSNSQLTIQHLETASILTIISSSRLFTGHYQCTIRNNFGTDTARMYLLVQEQPSPPAQVSPAAVLARSLLISWMHGFDGNSPITLYIIEMMEMDGSYTQVGTSTGISTSFNVTNLAPDTTYTFRVIAQNAIGNSPPSPEFQVRTNQAKPGSSPRNVSLSDITSEMITVSWIPPLLADWNGPIANFVIEYTLVLIPSEGASIVKTIPSTPTTPLIPSQENSQFSFTINQLESYQNYSLRITACTIVGCGVYSDYVHALTMETAPVAGPNVFRTDPTAVTIHVHWKEIPLRDRNGVIQSYTIRYFTPDNVNTTLRTGSSTRDFLIPNLSPYTIYRVYIAGETTSLGAFGPETSVRTGEAPPSPPTSLQVTYISYSQVSIHWSAPLTPNGVITLYTVYYNQSVITPISSTTIQTTLELSNISIRIPLHVSVSASTSAGEGVFSDVLKVAPAAPPYVITASNASNVTTHTLDVLVFLGDELLLECLIEGTPVPQFTWMSNLTGSLNGLPETVPRYYVPDTRPRFTSYYVCNGTNVFGTAIIMFHVTVVKLPEAFLHHSQPEFCMGINGGLNCRPGQTIVISCSSTEGIPLPVVNFTREGKAIEGVIYQELMARAEVIVQYLNNDTSHLYTCEAINVAGRDTKEIFINLVGTFTIIVNEDMVSWKLSSEGYVGGYYVIEYGRGTNISEFVANITSSLFDLSDIIVDPGVYAWRLKFVNQYGDAAISINYPFFVSDTPTTSILNMEWLIALLVLLAITIVITIIIIIIICVCICRRRYRYASGSTIPTQVVSNPATSGGDVVTPVDTSSSKVSASPRIKKGHIQVDRSTFRKKEDYNRNEAYRGPLAFHNQAFERDKEPKPGFTGFKPASNLHFKRQKSPFDHVDAVGFRRKNTPDFPAPPPIGDMRHDAAGDPVGNFTPPPPPVPDATYQL